jgi:hypothetical protein
MITRLDTESGDILGFKMSGTLTEGDYREILVPEMERAIRRHGTIHMMLYFEDFEGWTPGAAWEDIKLAPKLRHIDRIAIIGRENLEQWMADLAKFFAGFTDAELRFFREEQRDEARDWVMQESERRAVPSASARGA